MVNRHWRARLLWRKCQRLFPTWVVPKQMVHWSNVGQNQANVRCWLAASRGDPWLYLSTLNTSASREKMKEKSMRCKAVCDLCGVYRVIPTDPAGACFWERSRTRASKMASRLLAYSSRRRPKNAAIGMHTPAKTRKRTSDLALDGAAWVEERSRVPCCCVSKLAIRTPWWLGT